MFVPCVCIARYVTYVSFPSFRVLCFANPLLLLSGSILSFWVLESHLDHNFNFLAQFHNIPLYTTHINLLSIMVSRNGTAIVLINAPKHQHLYLYRCLFRDVLICFLSSVFHTRVSILP